MSAKSTAISQLGKEDDYINLKGFNTERDIAQDTYNNDYNALQNKFNELLATADRNKASAKTDFNVNRNTLNNNSYMSTRGKTGADLSSRGLSKGFGSGGKFVSNLQRNNASSTLANTYYDAMADIQRDIDKGTQDHNYNMEKLKLDLDRTIASINAREAEKRNAYRTAVAQLAEQIQARWDADANAKATLAAMREQTEANKKMEIYTRISEIFNNKKLTLSEKIKQAASLYTNLTGSSDGEGYLYSQGFINKNEYSPYISSPVTGNATKSTANKSTLPNSLPIQRPTNTNTNTGTIPNNFNTTSNSSSKKTNNSELKNYTSSKPTISSALLELWR